MQRGLLQRRQRIDVLQVRKTVELPIFLARQKYLFLHHFFAILQCTYYYFSLICRLIFDSPFTQTLAPTASRRTAAAAQSATTRNRAPFARTQSRSQVKLGAHRKKLQILVFSTAAPHHSHSVSNKFLTFLEFYFVQNRFF